MHLAVDAVAAKHSGAATVLLDFLSAAVDDERLSRVTVFCAPQGMRSFQLTPSSKLIVIEKAIAERSRLARLLWYMIGLGRVSRKVEANVLLCLSGQGQAIPPTPHVTFIQQSLPFSPEALARVPRKRRLEMAVTWQLMKQSCQTAQHIIVQTPTMANWISRAFSLKPSEVQVATPVASMPAVENDHSTELQKMRAAPPGARLLYVGSNSGYKLVDTLIAGMPFLREQCPQASLFLTLEPSSKYGAMPGVVCLGHLRRELLQEAYNLCTAVVMPSLVETVGLPMIEAMSLGKPVIAADRPYAHDICEDAALFYDPLDARDFATKALHMLQSEQLQELISARGRELTTHRQLVLPYRTMVDSVVSAAQRPTHAMDINR